MTESITLPSTPTHNSASSSPPRSSTSTQATTAEKDKPVPTSEVHLDHGHREEEEPQDSDVEVVDADDDEEGRKAKSTKRKSQGSPSVKPAKKAKSSKSTPKAASKAKSTLTPSRDEAKLVEFKNGKLVHKQKAGPKVDAATSVMIERVAFVSYAVNLFKDDSLPFLKEWPPEHLGVIAKAVHESPLTLVGLAKSIKSLLADAIEPSMHAGDDWQEEKEGDRSVADRIDLAALKKTIESLATRINYGLDASDLPDGLPEGVSAVPSTLQHWVWEVTDSSLLPTEFVQKFEKRKAEREEIKRAALELFLSLPAEDQTALLEKKATGSSSASKAAATSTAKDKSNAKGKGKAKATAEEESDEKEKEEKKPPKGQGKKKELTEEEKQEAEHKARVKAEEKAEKEAEKEAKRKEREAKKAAKAEKDAADAEKKAQKAKEKAEKKAVEEKKQAAFKKQQNMLSGFLVKKSPSLEADQAQAGPSSAFTLPLLYLFPSNPSYLVAAATPSVKDGKRPESDFNRVFRPFHVRPGVELAPINRFALNAGTSVEVNIDSKPDLTLKDSLASFTKSVPKRRIPPYNPHPEPSVSVREAVRGITDSNLTSQDASEWYALLKDREKIAVKFLKFREDVRPGYIGTWTKTSRVVGPRTPFDRDGGLLKYDYDSEAEWEDEPDDADAENVESGGEMSDEADSDAASEADSWLAEDDEIEYEEGYDAEGDVVMMNAEEGGRKVTEEGDDDVIVVASAKDQEKERRRKDKERKKKAEERAKKKKMAGPLLPLIKGPAWEDQEGKSSEPVFKAMKIQFLNDAAFGLDPFTFVSHPFSAPIATASVPSKGKENVSIPSASTPTSTNLADIPTTTASSSRKARPFPDQLLPRLLRDIHGSDKSRNVLVDEFVRWSKAEGVPCTKTAVEAKYKDIGVMKVKGKMVVPEEMLAKFGIPA
ncbi:hypothetical protein JCM21900_006197 [Sporobolomyces salmonicolor]